jgi:DNA primase
VSNITNCYNKYNIVEEIKTHQDIIYIIGEVTGLTRKGPRYWGLCPFHNEKTPSFSVNPERQLFYCFGCHTKGDKIAFVMQYYHLSFKETKDWLTQRYGIDTRMDPEARAAAWKTIQIQKRERAKQQAQEIYLKTLVDREYTRLIALERVIHKIVGSVTSETDMDRPEVVEAFRVKDRISYYLDVLTYGEPADKLALTLSTRGVTF